MKPICEANDVARVFNPCLSTRSALPGTGWKPVLQVACALAMAFGGFSPGFTFAQAAPTSRSTTQPASLPTPTADFELHEWAVFIAEPLSPRANAVGVFKSTLPSFVVSRRTDESPDKRNDAMPVGVIRIIGGVVPTPKFDVLLNLRSGEFKSQWPKATENRANRLLWSNLIADDAKAQMNQLDEKHWMTRLRERESRYLTSGRDPKGERFLLYDVEPGYQMPLRVEPTGDGTYRVSNAGATTLTNVELYKQRDGAWRKAFVEELPANRAASKPATAPIDPATLKIKPGDSVLAAFEFTQNYSIEREKGMVIPDNGNFSLPIVGDIKLSGRTVEQAEKEITEKFKTTGYTISKVTVQHRPMDQILPTTGPTGTAVEMTLKDESAPYETNADPKQLFAPWSNRLKATGLTPVDNDLILNILARYATDSGRLTAVYMLDRTQMDELIPQEVVPQPNKTVRVGLVIVRNIDPQINEEITALVKQLGDDEWATREAAQKKLMTFGRAAKTAVEKAAKEKDLEVVWRAEAVLRSIEPKFQPMGQ